MGFAGKSKDDFGGTFPFVMWKHDGVPALMHTIAISLTGSRETMFGAICNAKNTCCPADQAVRTSAGLEIV